MAYTGKNRRIGSTTMDTQQILEMNRELAKIASDIGYMKETVNEIKARFDKNDAEKQTYALKKDLDKHCLDNEEHIEVAKKAPELIKKVEDHEVRITTLEKTPLNNAYSRQQKIKDWIFMGSVSFVGLAVLKYKKYRIKMLLQNNLKLLPKLRDLGCYALSLGALIEIETAYEFSADEINDVWLASTQKNYIDTKDRIVNPDGILKEYRYRTGIPFVTFAQVGQEMDGRIIFWNWAEKQDLTDYEYAIEMRLTNGKHGTHFVLCNARKELLFDSYSFKEYNFKPSGRYLFYKKIT